MVKSVAWPRARVRAVLMWRKQKKKPTSPTDCVPLMPLSGAKQLFWGMLAATGCSETSSGPNLLPKNALAGTQIRLAQKSYEGQGPPCCMCRQTACFHARAAACG